MKLKVNFCLLLIMLLSGCDPMKVLIIKAVDKPGISVIVYGNSKTLSGYFSGSNEKIVISLPNQTRRDTMFFYGIGTWEGGYERMASFAKDIDSIIMYTSKGKRTLVSKPEITKYLLRHRSGMFKHILTIKAK